MPRDRCDICLIIWYIEWQCTGFQKYKRLHEQSKLKEKINIGVGKQSVYKMRVLPVNLFISFLFICAVVFQPQSFFLSSKAFHKSCSIKHGARIYRREYINIWSRNGYFWDNLNQREGRLHRFGSTSLERFNEQKKIAVNAPNQFYSFSPLPKSQGLIFNSKLLVDAGDI